MSLSTPQDINVIIIVPGPDPSSNTVQVRTERRITPSWTVSQLKTKLEPITGIPSTSQSISNNNLLFEPDTQTLDHFHLGKYSELTVTDQRPPGARGANLFSDPSVEKYEMPAEQYERLDDSVLAWKRRQKLGRFDPGAKTGAELADERNKKDAELVRTKGTEVGKRCRVGGEDERRGTVRFVGEIEGLGGERERGCVWVGVELDEPVGRSDGSVSVVVDGSNETTVKRVFECKDKFGVFARPEKIEVGDWPPLDDLDEDMEEM